MRTKKASPEVLIFAPGGPPPAKTTPQSLRLTSVEKGALSDAYPGDTVIACSIGNVIAGMLVAYIRGKSIALRRVRVANPDGRFTFCDSDHPYRLDQPDGAIMLMVYSVRRSHDVRHD